ncbi:MAG: CBS domain-containing protein [Anaerolineae bacterium]|nr:CBS domain-containing protein [Anaerolineae bacterium]
MTAKLVRDWMTSEVIMVSSSCTLPDAYWLMLEHDIRRLPVVDDGTLVGIVTLNDLRHPNIASIGGFVAGLDIIHINENLSRLPVQQLMTKNPHTVGPEASLLDAARLMLKHRVSALPVLEAGRLVGIITESDIFRAFVEGEENA